MSKAGITIGSGLSMADGPSVYGDLLGLAVYGLTIALASTLPNTKSTELEKLEENIKRKNKKEKEVVFPANPYDFKPNGLTRYEYATPNGLVIKWFIPSTNYAVFEWDEDLNRFSHYHVLTEMDQSRHISSIAKKHRISGELVPSPFDKIYTNGVH